ncbi:LysR family transcriptional regulator [Palleronia sediminis]|uniref:LysR family transcriptional regulator n=1 Tax=Palleronia sediminis TaxID=2547833 RepID=A0A4R5ZXS9_9RHOB|nr:LysR family transcriptional regulator [Palleronia sediminis]TDL75981.1 LysR family transcriptional regulator [Palleronia sediminis]
MSRNLDLVALRSFVAVAESGGVTRAAGALGLTQSAVSMQMKRLEDNLGISLIDRTQRSVALTPAGDQLLSYARRLLQLNDEAVARLTDDRFEGQVTLGVPHDIIYPALPPVLHRLSVLFPRVEVRLHSLPTRSLLARFGRGELDVILTTEQSVGPGGETLVSLPLVWIGARGGTAWRERPVKLAFCSSCIFRQMATRALDAAGIGWQSMLESDSDAASDVALAADLGIRAHIGRALPPFTEEVPSSAGLPDLAHQNINLYVSPALSGTLSQQISQVVRDGYARAAFTPQRIAAE